MHENNLQFTEQSKDLFLPSDMSLGDKYKSGL